MEKELYYNGNRDGNNKSLVGEYANADWGVYNAISNGGNRAGLWRTLTRDEIYYLLVKRPKADSLYSIAYVNGHYGLLLMPDDWKCDSINFFPQQGYNANHYNASDWASLQKLGAVFFPAAGYRTGKSVGQMEFWGLYWSSTADPKSDEYVFSLTFYTGIDNKLEMGKVYYGNSAEGQIFLGLAVRLVHDIVQPAE